MKLQMSMSSAITLRLLLALLALASPVQAGTLTSHSFVIALVNNDDHPFVSIESDGPSDTGVVSDFANGNPPPGRVEATARAFTGLDGSTFLHVRSTAYNDFGSGVLGEAVAGWRDVATINGGSTPEFITLHFRVGARLSEGGANSATRLGISKVNDVSATEWQIGNSDTVANAYLFGSGFRPFDGLQVGGFDTHQYINGLFVGTFHIDAPYNANLGGYGWGVVLIADSHAVAADGNPGSAETNALNSVGFVRATDPAGNPIEVSFESGLSPAAAVPEPSSLVLLVTGAFGAVFCRWRKRRPSAANGWGSLCEVLP